MPQHQIHTLHNTTLSYQAPILVEKLVQAFKTHQKLGTATQENLFWAINDTLGQYMGQPSSTRESAARAIHVQKLFSLVQNARIDAPEDLAQDARQSAEAQIEQYRSKVLQILGQGFTACHLVKLGNWCKHAAAQSENPDAKSAAPRPGSLRHILQNKHQFSRLTLGLAKISHGLKLFNSHVVLCRSGLLARFIAKGLRILAYKWFQVDLGILQSFILGRMLSCGIWAVLEALALAYATGQGHGFQSSLSTTAGPGPFPIKLAFSRTILLLTVVNTALQMLVVHSFALVFQGQATASAWADSHVWGLQKPNEKELAQQEQHKLVFHRPQLTNTAINPF